MSDRPTGVVDVGSGRWRSLGCYVALVAVAVRATVWYLGSPIQGWVAALLGVYALLLAAEPLGLLSRTPARVAYLVSQLGLVFALLLLPPYPDFIAMLFFPLSLQAVLFFSWRSGLAWISAFGLAASVALVVVRPDTPLLGLGMSLLYVGTCFVLGWYAHFIKQATAARVENRRLYDELEAAHRRLREYARREEELSAAQERRKLARDLHDSVTQTLFGMSLTAQTARLLFERDPGQVVAQLAKLQELARSAQGELEVLTAQLGPEPVAGEGLVAALRVLARQRLAHDGLEVSLAVSGGEVGARDLSDLATAGLFHIVQEALNNVAKHAQTREVAVTLSLDARPRTIQIEDHGVGFDVATRREAGHFGLSSMLERARAIGWRFCVESRPGVGTRIKLEEDCQAESTGACPAGVERLPDGR